MWTKSNDKNEQKKALQDPAGGLAKAGVWYICAKSFMNLQSNLFHKMLKETSAFNWVKGTSLRNMMACLSQC